MAESLASVAAPAVAAVSAAIGWYIAHALSSRRDHSNEIRKRYLEYADSLIKQVRETTRTVIKYHTQPRDVGLEFEVKSSLQQVGISLATLMALAPSAQNKDPTQILFVFRRTSMGSHFEEDHTVALDSGALLLVDIQAAALDFETQLRDSQVRLLTASAR